MCDTKKYLNYLICNGSILKGIPVNSQGKTLELNNARGVKNLINKTFKFLQMKKIFLSIISLVFLSNILLAGEYATKRKNCVPVVNWKYRCGTQIGSSNPDNICKQVKFGCNGQWCQCTDVIFGVTAYKNNAWSNSGGAGTNQSILDANLWTLSGHTAGYATGDLIPLSTLPIIIDEGYDASNFTEGIITTISTTEMNFNESNHSIDINFDKIQLSTPSTYNLANTFKMVRYTIYDESRENLIVAEGKAYIINGKLYTDGAFTYSDFSNSSTSDLVNYVSENLYKSISIPNEYNLDNLIVVLNSESADLSVGLPADFRIPTEMNKIINDNAKNLEYNKNIFSTIISNNSVNCIVNNISNFASNYQITVLNSIGEVVNNSEKIILNSNEQTSINFSNLNTGLYFVSLVDLKTNKKIINKIVIN
jgi:hypothetical protein